MAKSLLVIGGLRGCSMARFLLVPTPKSTGDFGPNQPSTLVMKHPEFFFIPTTNPAERSFQGLFCTGVCSIYNKECCGMLFLDLQIFAETLPPFPGREV